MRNGSPRTCRARSHYVRLLGRSHFKLFAYISFPISTLQRRYTHKRAAREQKGQAKALCKSVRLYNNVLISLTPKSSLENFSAFFNASIECNTNSTLYLKKITHVTKVKEIGSRKKFKKKL
jgi:hypothetical protein